MAKTREQAEGHPRAHRRPRRRGAAQARGRAGRVEAHGHGEQTRDRLDEVQKKLRGLDELEKRVAKLEKQLAATTKPARSRQRKPAARKPAAPKSPAGLGGRDAHAAARRGTTSKRTGVVPGCSPSSSTGSGASRRR